MDKTPVFDGIGLLDPGCVFCKLPVQPHTLRLYCDYSTSQLLVVLTWQILYTALLD